VKKQIGLALMLGGLGYAARRLYEGTVFIKTTQHVGVDKAFGMEWAIFKTSGAVPCAVAVAVGAYPYWKA